MDGREAIIRYKLAARTYRRGGIDRQANYSALEAARAMMIAALGYARQYGYLGEFCNLHERDFPNMISCRPDFDGRYRHHGFARRISKDEHKDELRACRKRALFLSRVFCQSPLERFISGFHISYGEDDRAAYIDGKLLLFKSEGFCTVAIGNLTSTQEQAAWFFETFIAKSSKIYWQALMDFDVDAGLRLAA